MWCSGFTASSEPKVGYFPTTVRPERFYSSYAATIHVWRESAVTIETVPHYNEHFHINAVPSDQSETRTHFTVLCSEGEPERDYEWLWIKTSIIILAESDRHNAHFLHRVTDALCQRGIRDGRSRYNRQIFLKAFKFNILLSHAVCNRINRSTLPFVCLGGILRRHLRRVLRVCLTAACCKTAS